MLRWDTGVAKISSHWHVVFQSRWKLIITPLTDDYWSETRGLMINRTGGYGTKSVKNTKYISRLTLCYIVSLAANSAPFFVLIVNHDPSTDDTKNDRPASFGRGPIVYDVVESMSPQRTLLKSMCVSGWFARMSSGLPSVALQGPASPLSIQFMKSPSLFQMEKMRTEPRSRARPWASRPPRRRPSVLLASQNSWDLLVCDLNK